MALLKEICIIAAVLLAVFGPMALNVSSMQVETKCYPSSEEGNCEEPTIWDYE